MTKFKRYFKQNRRYILASFLIPFGIMALTYLLMGIYPGSSRSVLASDSFSQFSNFHASFRNMLLGKQGIFYTWNASLGLNYLSLISYYLGGLFTPLVIFFPNQYMPDALYVITLLKIGCAGLAFWFYSSQTFKIAKWNAVGLSVAYALTSFATAHSEIIMWLDTFIYLPLIILGIDRLIQRKKPTVLFFSYLMMFLTSFYMGFMVGVFSVLYFASQYVSAFRQTLKATGHYILTSLLAGLASMIIILPAVLDLRENGESLTKITNTQTEATGLWDILMKNMVAVYDTTKYGSIPFIYVGLLPLAFCLFYFVTKKIRWQEKVAYGLIFALLIASFYWTPLNLFWHGFHAPNMFLFRYAYLFAFMVIVLAGYGWEKLDKEDLFQFSGIIVVLMALFCLAWGMKGENYVYVSVLSFSLTLAFLFLYLVAFGLVNFHKVATKHISLLILVLMSAEALVNTNGMLRGILDDWNYASRSLYTDPYQDIKTLVDKADDQSPDFYRLENLDGVSANDSFSYGYSGIGMFSSIRNRNSSSFLDALGFRSRGTNLNIRYQNNTLLMDSFTGVKYNIAKSALSKFGFTPVSSSGEYSLYENRYSLPLAFTAPTSIYDVSQIPNDNLASQTNLFNGLAEENLNYFSFIPITVAGSTNTKISENGAVTTFTEEEQNVAKDISWVVTIPAHTQAYLSLFPSNFNQLSSSTVTVSVGDRSTKTQLSITGQYHDLGYYDQATTITVKASFYGSSAISFQTPKILALDTDAYTSAIEKIQENAVDMTVGNQSASGVVTAKDDRVLMTTIPFDAGWKAYLDDKEVAIKAYDKAFVSIEVPAGTHKVKFVYVPQGFKLGAALFVGCLLLFILYRRLWYQKQASASLGSEKTSRKDRRR